MRDFVLVFNILYRNANVRKVDVDGKRKMTQRVVLFIVGIPLIVLFCLMVGVLVYSEIKTITQLSALVTSIVALSQVAAALFGVYGVISTLYSGDDRALLNSLPLRPAAIFMAKSAICYIQLLKISTMFMLPLSLTASITYAALGREMFYAFFILIFVVAAIAPVLPLAIITLFSLPISYIGSYLKGHAVLKSVLSILMYVGIFAVYMTAMFAINGSARGGEESAFAGVAAGLDTFAKVFYPSKVAVDCALGIDGAVNFGISVAITVALVVLTLGLSTLFYRRVAQRSLEAGDDKSRHREISYKQSGIISALIKRDFLSIIRNPQMAMSNFSNLLLGPVFIVISYFGMVRTLTTGQGEDGMDMQIFAQILGLALAFMFSSLYLGGANILALLAFSREGKAFFLNRTLPIPAGVQVRAKLIFAMATASVVNVIDFVVVLTLFHTHFANALMLFVCNEMCLAGGVGLNIYADARWGNVNWTTRQELQQISGNINRFWVALACMVAPLIALFAGSVLGGIGIGMGFDELALFAIFWAICAAPSAVFMGIGLHLALSQAAKYLDDFGERKYVVRKRSLRSGKQGGYVPPRGGLMR